MTANDSAFPNTFREGARAAQAVIDAHTPSLTDQDEIDLGFSVGFASEDLDIASLALRTCACGERVDGFYEYVSHLQVEINKATS